jgi:hypothetical protein
MSFWGLPHKKKMPFQCDFMWTLEQAITEIRSLEPKLAAIGFHCALNGSVLYRGESQKDLDLIVYPHTKNICESTNFEPCKEVLRLHFQSAFIKDCGSASQLRDDKQVAWVTDGNNKRIDIFFLD